MSHPPCVFMGTQSFKCLHLLELLHEAGFFGHILGNSESAAALGLFSGRQGWLSTCWGRRGECAACCPSGGRL